MKKLHLDFTELLKVLHISTSFPEDHLTALNYFNRLEEPDLVCEELRNELWLPLSSKGRTPFQHLSPGSYVPCSRQDERD